VRPLDEALELVPELAGRERTVPDPPGGLTNLNTKVVCAAGCFVVRRWSDDTGLLAIDRDREYENSVKAAAVGVGAQVIAYLPAVNAMVFEYLEGPTMSAEDLRRGDRLDEVAAVVRALIAISRDFAADPQRWVEAMTKARPDVSRSDLRAMAKAFAGSWSVNGGLNRAELEYTVDWAYRSPDFNGVRKVALPEWVDFSLVDEALQAAGPFPGMDKPGR